jgi:hypothetical protein
VAQRSYHRPDPLFSSAGATLTETIEHVKELEGTFMADERLAAAAERVGTFKLGLAFKQAPFVYGTQGSGSAVVRGLKAFAARTRQPKPGEPASGAAIRRVVDRELNLFDAGRRTLVYLAENYQMMDLYYGQAGTNLHLRRNPVIAEFMHYAMGFDNTHLGFSMNVSGREAYMQSFKTSNEGWKSNSPGPERYNGLTATKEMSRIIRWGIFRYGGKIVFEGRDIYYSQVFDPGAPRVSDTDLEARHLFSSFMPGQSTAKFGRGSVTFHWSNRETVPTRLHFITNWSWADGETHLIANMLGYSSKRVFLPIWNNFAPWPAALGGYQPEDIVTTLANEMAADAAAHHPQIEKS